MMQEWECGSLLRRDSAVIAAIGAGTFAFAFQVSTLLAIMPTLGNFLRRPFSTDWALTVYLLFLSALLITFGRAGDLLGTRRVYMTGLIGFSAASILCALATLPLLFLVGRALEGVGAAMCAANSPAILSRNVGPRHLGRALGWQAAGTYLGLTLGPMIGAYTVTRFCWRAVFLLEIPIALIAVILSAFAIPADTSTRTGKSHMSVFETVVWMLGLLPLLLALDRSSEWGWLSLKIAGLLAVSLIACAIFVRSELRRTSPLLDVRMFTEESFSVPVTAEFLFYLALYALAYLVPMLVVRGRGMPAAWAGILLTTQSLMRMVVAPASGMLADRLGARRVLSIGVPLLFAAILILVSATSVGSIMTFLVASGLIGLGTGSFVPANSTRFLSAVAPERRAVASGVLATARNLGMMFGVAAAAASYSNSVAAVKGPLKILGGIRWSLSIPFLAVGTIILLNVITNRGLGFVEGRKGKAQETAPGADSTLPSAI